MAKVAILHVVPYDDSVRAELEEVSSVYGAELSGDPESVGGTAKATMNLVFFKSPAPKF